MGPEAPSTLGVPGRRRCGGRAVDDERALAVGVACTDRCRVCDRPGLASPFRKSAKAAHNVLSGLVDLLIRSLVRPVRRHAMEGLTQVERPAWSVPSRWCPTSWVHDGYTVTVLDRLLANRANRGGRRMRPGPRTGSVGLESPGLVRSCGPFVARP